MAASNARNSRRAVSKASLRVNHANVVSIANRSEASEARAPLASEELEAALRETGAAVHAIIDEAESVLALDHQSNRDYAAMVRASMLRVLEVCAFEDLTGQRISKAADVLRLAEGLATPSNENHDRPELNGPALNAPHMSQAQIDEVFAK